MYHKGQIGCSLTRVKVKKGIKQPPSKRKLEQMKRLQRENELYEMIQLPNGDFIKQKRESISTHPSF